MSKPGAPRMPHYGSGPMPDFSGASKGVLNTPEYMTKMNDVWKQGQDRRYISTMPTAPIPAMKPIPTGPQPLPGGIIQPVPTGPPLSSMTPPVPPATVPTPQQQIAQLLTPRQQMARTLAMPQMPLMRRFR